MHRYCAVGQAISRNALHQRRWNKSVPDVVRSYLKVLSENSVDVVELMGRGDDMSDEVRQLNPNFEIAMKYGQLLKSYEETKQISDESKELAEMAEDELKEMETEIDDIQAHFDDILQLRDEGDDLDIILETHGGAGGSEADIFAEELFNQYQVYVKNCEGWTWTTISEFDPSTASSDNDEDRVFRAKVTGNDVFRSLKWEAGVHRVQRVPTTEGSGRVHTSTAGVKIFPMFEDTESTTKFKQGDFSFKGMRNTGPGGQGVNSTNSACQVIHKPTGLMVREFCHRGYEKNRDLAVEKLKAMVWEREQEEKLKARGEAKASLAFSLDRFNRIRTYNWGRHSVHDHRLQTNHTVLLETFFDDDGEGIEHFVRSLEALDLSNRREGWINEQIDKQKELQLSIKKKLGASAA